MRERGISKEEISAAMKNPDNIDKAALGRIKNEKFIDKRKVMVIYRKSSESHQTTSLLLLVINMKITYDKQAEALYIYLRPYFERSEKQGSARRAGSYKQIKETREVGPNTLVDVAHNGDIIGIEILGVKAHLAKQEIKKLLTELAIA